ncbi:MAG: SDR family oxidoreductase [Clostridia bacterium]|nr:SDR family oxidoreductase [Clostridia bacterium]
MSESKSMEQFNSCFIFGAHDAIGSCVKEKLNARGVEVTAFIPDSIIADVPVDAEYAKANLEKISREQLTESMKGYDVAVYNLMPEPFQSVSDGVDLYEFYRERLVNIPLKTLECAIGANVKKIIFVGSCLSYFARTWREMHLKDRHPYLKAAAEAEDLLVRAGKGAESGGIDTVFIESSLCFGARATVWKDIFLDRFSKMRDVCFAKGGVNIATPECIADGIIAAAYFAEHGKLLPVGDADYGYKFIINTMMETIGSPDRYKATRPWRFRDFGTVLKREFKAAGKVCGLDHRYIMKDIFECGAYLHNLADNDVVGKVREYLRYSQLGIVTDYDSAEGIRRSMRSIYPHRFDENGRLKAEWIGVKTTPNESN